MAQIMDAYVKPMIVMVDYGRRIEQGIKAGNYDEVNKDITDEHFPPSEKEVGTQEHQCTLYHFGIFTESDWVIAQMKTDGKRPAPLRVLLAVGEAKPCQRALKSRQLEALQKPPF